MIRGTLCILFLLLVLTGLAQPDRPISVNVKDKPLNEVLHQLRDQYGLQLSYTENELSKYKVSVQKQFETDEETLNFLLNTLPFRLKKAGKVFIIIPLKKGKTGQKSDVHISGQIVESGTREPLSYSNIIINKKKLVADVTGSFNFIASADSSFHLQISHLGYFVFDTVLYTGIDQHFTLKPSITPLPEIKVQNRPIDRSTLIGDIAGNMKINHNIAQYLPGQGDNSIFNLLRLMPGIQATNEQSADLQLSGSQEGQSLMTFDGFTLFGLKNYNNNISIINPFLVKNINIYQGSFPAQYGNRVGGLVQLIGKNGSLQKPTFSFNLNATTVNGMAELPLFRKSSLVIAYRQTYYNLYNSNNFNIYAPTHSKNETTRTPVNFNTNLNGFDVYPDNYRYRDFNAKYTINPNKNDQLYFSLYLGGDKYRLTTLKELKPSNSEDPPETRNPLLVDFSDREKNSQDGFSAFYSKKWSAKISSEFLFSRSSYSREAFQNTQAQAENTTTANTGNELEFSNTAKEYSFRNENRINRKDGKELTFGAGFYTNKASLVNINSYGDSLNLNSEQQFSNTHLYAFVKEHLPIGKKLIIDGGIRFLVANDGNKFIAEPRFSMQYKFTENLKLNVAGGRYHQFMYKLAHVDRDNNYNYFWVTSANSVPVLNATHYCLGLNYYKNSFTANVESYYKKTNNLSRQVFEQHQNAVPGWNSAYINYTGDAKAYGISTYLRKDFGNQAIWTSYNWSKALERLAKEGDALPGYVPAINDQRHEFKIAALLNYKRFYFSSDFVYGSGQKLIRQAFPDNDVSTDYQRVDLALTYKLNWEKSKTEFGVSVLNIFDRKNLSYNHLRSINLSPEFNVVKVYTNAVPLTPTIFLKIVF